MKIYAWVMNERGKTATKGGNKSLNIKVYGGSRDQNFKIIEMEIVYSREEDVYKVLINDRIFDVIIREGDSRCRR